MFLIWEFYVFAMSFFPLGLLHFNDDCKRLLKMLQSVLKVFGGICHLKFSFCWFSQGADHLSGDCATSASTVFHPFGIIGIIYFSFEVTVEGKKR